MLDKTTLQARLGAITILCAAANKAAYGTSEYKKISKSLWDSVHALDAEARLDSSTISPGRFVQFPHLDGYARYIVLRVGKVSCKLWHMPWADGYNSRMVNEKGEADTDEVENVIAQEDRITALFDANAGERAGGLLFGMGNHNAPIAEFHDVGRRGEADQPHHVMGLPVVVIED